MAKYRNALNRTCAETDQIVVRMDELRSLLNEFGASLSGYDPSVSAFLPGHGVGIGYTGDALDFNRTEWAWLEPLLKELREFRHHKYGARVKKAS